MPQFSQYMYIHLEIMIVKLATCLSDNPAGALGQRNPLSD